MIIDEKIFNTFNEEAKNIKTSRLTIGLGYTAVELEDGRTGIAYTWLDNKTGCSVIKSLDCFENEKASALLEKIYSEIPVERTIAIAAVNALNQKKAADFPDDKGCLTDAIKASPGSKIAMVGFFGPVIKQLESIGAETVVYDIGKGSGKAEDFYPFLENEADSLILTSTSLLNQSTEDILGYIKNRKIPAVMLGPTTIMEPEIYSHLPVTILAGTVPVDSGRVVQAIRNGKGTPIIQKFARKVLAAGL